MNRTSQPNLNLYPDPEYKSVEDWKRDRREREAKALLREFGCEAWFMIFGMIEQDQRELEEDIWQRIKSLQEEEEQEDDEIDSGIDESDRYGEEGLGIEITGYDGVGARLSYMQWAADLEGRPIGLLRSELYQEYF